MSKVEIKNMTSLFSEKVIADLRSHAENPEGGKRASEAKAVLRYLETSSCHTVAEELGITWQAVRALSTKFYRKGNAMFERKTREGAAKRGLKKKLFEVVQKISREIENGATDEAVDSMVASFTTKIKLNRFLLGDEKPLNEFVPLSGEIFGEN